MLKKLDWVHPRMEELGMLLSDPAVVQDQEKWRALMREHSQLEPLDQAVRRYAELEDAQKQARALLDEPDMAEMAKEELAELENRLAATRREIQLLLLPKDPNAERNVVMEIRSGAGGEEAALFGAMLMRMYMRYAERHGWKTEMLEASMTELREGGGFRHHGGGRVQPPEIRERRAPRSAHSGDGEQRQAADLHRDGRRAAGGGGG